MYQRQQQHYTMSWESFMDRVVVLACLLIILWMTAVEKE